MGGPIGHGVAKALRDARDKGADGGGRGGKPGPPAWLWLLVVAALIGAMVWAAIALR
jgi:hypothetical protein